MRLWHYKLIEFLPRSQLIAQWRELNSIFKKQDNHILINYVYEYNKLELEEYTCLVLNEMIKRKIKIRSWDNFLKYFNYSPLDHSVDSIIGFRVQHMKDMLGNNELFKNHHTIRYFIQCFFNLQEKYDRGQKDFSKEQYLKLYEFYFFVMANRLPRDFLNEEEKVIAQKIAWKNWEAR